MTDNKKLSGPIEGARAGIIEALGGANAKPAPEQLPGNDDGPINLLIREYARWNQEQGLNLRSADEHLHDEKLTEEQRAYLASFCGRWDIATETERAWSDTEAEAFKPCRHRDDGRGRCIDCGRFI
ncbi:hypothetical protein [Bradyrhizobium liaoningense]|uniref:hypothetical protein n=1 Tax=Bradyrhizobium liaoningense TaxID=43992 RepID=UPI001BAB9321|nr:hypothetical protein [Bradyrhizobium liaoningense]MBR1066875.1 hypothetical protein [Bradyrhizobium liaoningense]